MRIQVITLVGLAIGFALRIFAQEAEKIGALIFVKAMSGESRC